MWTGHSPLSFDTLERERPYLSAQFTIRITPSPGVVFATALPVLRGA